MSHHDIARRPRATCLSYTVCGLILWAAAILSLLAGRSETPHSQARLALSAAARISPCAAAR